MQLIYIDICACTPNSDSFRHYISVLPAFPSTNRARRAGEVRVKSDRLFGEMGGQFEIVAGFEHLRGGCLLVLLEMLQHDKVRFLVVDDVVLGKDDFGEEERERRLWTRGESGHSESCAFV